MTEKKETRIIATRKDGRTTKSAEKSAEKKAQKVLPGVEALIETKSEKQREIRIEEKTREKVIDREEKTIFFISSPLLFSPQENEKNSFIALK